MHLYLQRETEIATNTTSYLWPVKCNRGIPNKRHQAWPVPWSLHSNGESSSTGQAPKMTYYLNKHSPINSPQADFSPPLSLQDSTSSESFLLHLLIAWKGVLCLLPKGREGDVEDWHPALPQTEHAFCTVSG